MNKVAIITGAASGIGLETALLFAQEGAKLALTDLQTEKLQELVSTIRSQGGTAIECTHDVANESQWEDIISQAIKEYGHIDILVNNAGISLPTPFDQVTLAQWDKVMTVNATSVFLGSQLVSREMKKTGGGSIVNIGSMASLIGLVGAGPYTASKGTVRSLSTALAIELTKDMIRVNAVHPGFIKSNMAAHLYEDAQMLAFFEGNTPLPIHGLPEHIAPAVLFLASDESAFITGIDLPIDGGTCAR